LLSVTILIDNTKALQKMLETVLSENKMGYGYACPKGLEYISPNEKTRPDIVVFF
jgi:hypothetical protein